MPIYENRIVFFIDILGFKALIEKSINDNKSFDKITKAIEIFHNYKSNIENDTIQKSKQVTQFSDSIVISFRIEDESELFFTLLEIQHVIIDLINIGIVIRGGVGYGQCTHTEKVLFGPALVQAYDLESKYAKNPRIIIAKEVIDIAIHEGRSSHHSYEMENEYLEKILWKDSDDYYYLNYIDVASELDSEYDFPIYLSKLYEIITHGLNDTDNGVKRKYSWLKDLYNYAIDRIKDQLHIFTNDPDLYEGYFSLKKI